MIIVPLCDNTQRMQYAYIYYERDTEKRGLSTNFKKINVGLVVGGNEVPNQFP